VIYEHNAPTSLARSNPFSIPFAHCTTRSLSMRLQGVGEEIVGSDIEFPSFDPWEFSKDCDESKMFWYVLSYRV
jgi:hypothetical protein